MVTPERTPLTVVSMGLGSAGGNPNKLHGSAWEQFMPEAGFEVRRYGYDSDQSRREAAAQQIGSMIVLNSLAELPEALNGRRLDVLDVTTSSGHHAEAIRDVLKTLTGADLRMPTAIACEKPFVSSKYESLVMQKLLTKSGLNLSTFGIEQYRNSPALLQAVEIVRDHQKRGNNIARILVDASKDRRQDQQQGRYRDDPDDPKQLSVFGIEVPHMLAIVNALLGKRERLDTHTRDNGGDVISSTHYKNVNGISDSEGCFISARHGETDIVMKQALGPFVINALGGIKSREWNGSASRTATVIMRDESQLHLTFDPIGGGYIYHSKLVHIRPERRPQVYISPDESLPRTLQAVAEFALSGGKLKPTLLQGMGMQSSLRISRDLVRLRTIAYKSERNR